jgi:anti-sigma regulatory factor (Ser/Thr protein kinase)
MAILLTSELVTNALVHGRTPIEVDLTSADGMIRIAVTDGSPELPKFESPSGLSDHGRGLPLVAGQANEWGVYETPFGKTTWFSLKPPV